MTPLPLPLAAPRPVAELWPAVAEAVARTLAGAGCALRDAVVLVPYAALIEPLRRAFAARPGWQPRVETVATLSASLGPAPEPVAGGISGDTTLDALQAQQWLAGLDVSAAERQAAAAALAEAAQALADAAGRQAPADRDAWLEAARRALPLPGDGPGAGEALLLQAAAAWAAQAGERGGDRLLRHRPSAWVLVRLGGADREAEPLVAAHPAPAWVLDLDPDPAEPFAAWAADAQVELWRAEGFEDEAFGAATAVLQALSHGPGRVALVALDRVLARRVLALLARRGVAVDDETGGKLSTTPQAARLLARLRAASPSAGHDERLDWLSDWAPARRQPQALAALDQLWRAGRNARLSDGRKRQAQALWQAARSVLQPWTGTGPLALVDWLALLQGQLQDEGELDELDANPAGRRLLQLLRVNGLPAAWRGALSTTLVDAEGFRRWFEAWCEATVVEQTHRPGCRVVLTPLARAVGRDFAHAVVAGLDQSRGAVASPTPALMGESLAARLGLPTRDEARTRQRLALAQLLRLPGLTLLWRGADKGAPQEPLPDILLLQRASRLAGRPASARPVPLAVERVPGQAAPVVQPRAPDALPAALSASAVEALRACPYRFFSRHVLGLSELPEVDEPAAKRDYGDWLHTTLHRFHAAAPAAADELPLLLQAAEAALRELDLDAADMLAFRASWDQLAPQYLGWWHRVRAAGWTWHEGEEPVTAAPPEWAPHTLRGRIDRIDRSRDGRWRIVDYKTGSKSSLQARVRNPLEDAQLAFYAALQASRRPDEPLEAIYLALDDPQGPQEVKHPDVAATAAELVEQLGRELARLRAGAPLPPLGVGDLCDTCEARGLCRKDDRGDA